MYREFMLDKNYVFVQDAISANTSLVSSQGDSGFWVCYGSLVLNTQKDHSDIDLLYVHDQVGDPLRIQSNFRGFPVTIYSVSRESLLQDGMDCRHGGYFAGKLLNPHVTYGASKYDRSDLLKAAGNYIVDFASAVSGCNPYEVVDDKQLATDSVLARLRICPWYINYFVRYYVLPNFDQLWAKMAKVIARSMVESGKVVPNGDGYNYLHKPTPEYVSERITLAQARFWALGSCLHGADPDFPNTYIENSKQYLEANGITEKPRELLSFLEDQYPKARRENYV